MCSLKTISNENGHDVIFVMSQFCTFLLLKHPQSNFLPSSLRALHTLRILEHVYFNPFIQC